MSSYEVRITESEVYVINVEASNEEEAEQKAFDILENCDDKGEHHDDSTSDASVCDIN